MCEELEELLLDEYFLLVRRIPGINLTPTAYWELDTYTTGHLLSLEKEIIEREEEEYRKSQGQKNPRDKSSQEMVDLVDEVQNEA